MKLIFITTLLLLNINLIISQFAPTYLYANFIPYGYNNQECSGNINGIGFSLSANGNCYQDIGHNENGYHESSWLVIVDALRVGVAEYHNYNISLLNETCTGEFVNAQSIKNGSCILTPQFMKFNGTVNSNPLSNQYSLVTITKSPVFIPNTQVFSQFNNDGNYGCSDNSVDSSSSSSSSSSDSSRLLYMMYTTVGTKFISNNTNDNGISLTTECSNNGEALAIICKDNDDSSCSTENVTMPCTPSQDSFNEVYCTPPTNNNNKKLN